MADARSGAHHLHIAGLRAALVAETVLVADGTKTYAGDDRHVAVGCSGKPLLAAIPSSLQTCSAPQWPAHSSAAAVL